jgi:hypothetical protein
VRGGTDSAAGDKLAICGPPSSSAANRTGVFTFASFRGCADVRTWPDLPVAKNSHSRATILAAVRAASVRGLPAAAEAVIVEATLPAKTLLIATRFRGGSLRRYVEVPTESDFAAPESEIDDAALTA